MAEGRYLVDANILLALANPDHSHRAAALRWFDRDGSGAWGTCILTESGFIRIMANRKLGGYSVMEATEILALLTEHAGHQFWPMADDWNTLSAPFAERLFGHQQVTDACFLGLAVREEGILVTMDKAIIHLAGAKYRKHLLLLDPG